MKKFMLVICVGSMLACAPELRSAAGERCDEQNACAEGFDCYRGFCVATESTSEPARIEEEGDAGADLSGARVDAGSAAAALPNDASGSVSKDASSAGNAAGDEDKPASKPAASMPAVTAQPATMSDAGGRAGGADAGQSAPAPEKKPAPAPTPAPGMIPPVMDAGAADAAVSVIPDAALPALPKNCTMQDCCEEAQRTARGEDMRGKGGKVCGCNDPALLPALVGTLTCTLGGVVGGLL